MARGTGVINEYMVGANEPVDSPSKNVNEGNGADVIAFAATFETEAADDAGSKYRLFRLNANLVPIWMKLNCDALTGATEADLGIYDTLENGGAVKDIDAFIDGANISGGKAMGSEQDGLAALAIADIGKAIYELAGDDNPTPEGEYDLVLTLVSEIAAAGTVSLRGLFAKQA